MEYTHGLGVACIFSTKNNTGEIFAIKAIKNMITDTQRCGIVNIDAGFGFQGCAYHPSPTNHPHRSSALQPPPPSHLLSSIRAKQSFPHPLS